MLVVETMARCGRFDEVGRLARGKTHLDFAARRDDFCRSQLWVQSVHSVPEATMVLDGLIESSLNPAAQLQTSGVRRPQNQIAVGSKHPTRVIYLLPPLRVSHFPFPSAHALAHGSSNERSRYCGVSLCTPLHLHAPYLSLSRSLRPVPEIQLDRDLSVLNHWTLGITSINHAKSSEV